MTPEPSDTRAGALIGACGLAVVAIAAIVVLLAIGLRPSGEGVEVTTDHKPANSPQGGDNGERRAARKKASANVSANRLFAPTSFWNRPLPARAAIDPESGPLVLALASQVQRERGTQIGPWLSLSGTTSLYRVARRQPTVRVHLDVRTSPGSRALQRAFGAVPIPRHAQPAAGPDAHMTIWQPSTDTLWEFFKADRRSDGWHADWGGAIREVSKSRGYYSTAAWPGATDNWGATASSLPVIGGTILVDDLDAGRIDHALALNVPAARPEVFAWPAQRTDGTGSPTALPEGARLRLDPDVDIGRLQLSRLGRMIARAAQRHGLVVRDQTGHATSFFLENTPRGRSAYRSLLGKKTSQDVLANFPWDRLQVLKMHLCRRAPCRRG